MSKVNGVGGIFFRARDPGALGAWYAEHLGVGGDALFVQEAGPTVFQPFAADTEYFGAAQQCMLNFRTDDLDGLVAALRGAGVEVDDGPQMPEVGRFARLHDPEGNAVELWEPAPGTPPGADAGGAS